MRILIAEDEVTLAKALMKILGRHNYSVDIVNDGESAEAYIETGIYDAIILDIMMPGKNGFEVLKAIRARGINTPVLILSAKSEVADKVRGLDGGANDYLTKPFATEELLARIRAITRPQETECTRLTYGNISLDRATYELSSPTRSYKLANREYQIMELFLSNPKRVISIDMMMEKIWGYNTEADISVVWVYISYLRKKLVALEANVAIKMSRNTGYSMELTDDKGA